VTLPAMHMPRVTYLPRPAHSGWLQGVVTGIALRQQQPLPKAKGELAVVQPASNFAQKLPNGFA